VRQGCGSCTRCIDACPTGALDEPGVLDATRCLSYWTQSRHAAPTAVQDALADRVYGCDICQDVCPWNAGPDLRANGGAATSDGEAWVSLVDWLEASDEDLRERYTRLYVPDRDPRFLRRNALVALGNGPPEHRHLAGPFARSGDPVLAGPALRALGRAGGDAA
jgi:epoxyqueuosine reductase